MYSSGARSHEVVDALTDALTEAHTHTQTYVYICICLCLYIHIICIYQRAYTLLTFTAPPQCPPIADNHHAVHGQSPRVTTGTREKHNGVSAFGNAMACIPVRMCAHLYVYTYMDILLFLLRIYKSHITLIYTYFDIKCVYYI